jgi:hypothetical protein
MISLRLVWTKRDNWPPIRLGCMLMSIYRYSNSALAIMGNESAFCHGTPCRCEELFVCSACSLSSISLCSLQYLPTKIGHYSSS